MRSIGNSRRITEKHEGESILGGTDVGKFPRHHFILNSNIEFESRWPLKVIVCGDDEWVEGCSRYRKRTNIFSLELICEGSLEFTQRGNRYHVGAGELLVIQPGADYQMAAREYCRKKVMIIGGYMLSSLLSAGGWAEVDTLKPADAELIAGYFDRVYEAGDERSPGYLNFSSSQAYQLLLELAADIKIAGMPPEFNRILGYLEENLIGNPTAETICERFGISRSTLFRMFRKYFDCSPADYLIRKRLQIARDLLAQSHYSIKEISTRLGYANQFFFSNQFKARYQLSPRAFRESLLQKM